MYLGVLVYEKEKKRDKKLVEPQDNSITVSGLLMTPKSDFVRTVYIFWPNSAQHGAQENCLWLSNRSLCCVCTYAGKSKAK